MQGAVAIASMLGALAGCGRRGVDADGAADAELLDGPAGAVDATL